HQNVVHHFSYPLLSGELNHGGWYFQNPDNDPVVLKPLQFLFDCILVPPKPVQLFYNNLIAPLNNRLQPMIFWPVKILPTHLIGKHFIWMILLDRIYLTVKMLVFCGYTDIRILHFISYSPGSTFLSSSTITIFFPRTLAISQKLLTLMSFFASRSYMV